VPIDELIPEHLIPKKANLTQSYFTQITALIREKKLTLRELYTTYDRGKITICGTPEQIVDHMEEWVDGGAADGFMLAFHVIPNDLEDFVRQVVPEMQRRGRLRKHYTGTTLRENLGLQRPASRHVR
jgi:alkanesulfonate monooxygenase SsuD/methylene tetrahydromethanopterin reductase-like flavin-dependent oxidoreductase (luciferase family)